MTAIEQAGQKVAWAVIIGFLSLSLILGTGLYAPILWMIRAALRAHGADV